MVGPNKLWLSINTCLHILAVKKAYFYNSLVLKYDYEFLNCILGKMKLRGGGECLSLSLSPTPQGGAAWFGVARSGYKTWVILEHLWCWKQNFLQFWQPRARFASLSNVWARYRLTVHFKPEKVSSLIENVQWLWRWGAPPPKPEKMPSRPEPRPYKRP